MNDYASRKAESKTEFVKNSVIQKKHSGQVVSAFLDHRPERVVLRKQQEMMNRSSRHEAVIQCLSLIHI